MDDIGGAALWADRGESDAGARILISLRGRIMVPSVERLAMRFQQQRCVGLSEVRHGFDRGGARVRCRLSVSASEQAATPYSKPAQTTNSFRPAGSEITSRGALEGGQSHAEVGHWKTTSGSRPNGSTRESRNWRSPRCSTAPIRRKSRNDDPQRRDRHLPWTCCPRGLTSRRAG